ncbi:SusE domain-containing protein [Proteiniphilum sp. UBA5384]|uniref:SusE domain-containing protein n=1 Tax=Proteiniphilum sp. UBA5384 TaxID=1947279 RepID=UPI0025D01B1E|nr:SusE domain-containing protein [Proteiniphilum sp. UBA5384]
MKREKIQIGMIGMALIAALVFAFGACSSDLDVRHLGVTAVKKLYNPHDDKALILKSTASMTFSWEPAYAEDGSGVLYEVVFDKMDGDFSNPLYVRPSGNNGSENEAVISHKELNRIAAMAGIEAAQQGTLKWTIFSSRGINPVKALEERTLTLIRLAGLANIPEQLYITGEATEVGDDLSKALMMKKVGDDEFEIYTQLEGGKSFRFVSAKTGTPLDFSVDGAKLVEGGTSSVSTTGIYKYRLDFSTGSFETKEVTKVVLFLNWAQREIELPYKGLGVWELTDYTITGLTGSDNSDDRYKFRMESSTVKTEWRSKSSNDSKPTGNASYYYMEERDNVTQWTNNEIWKTPATDGWSDKTYDFMFSLSTSGEYTHNLVIK